MAALSIVRPGMFTTVQDLGRWGFQSRGVPVTGALDWFSHRLANRLVGNDADAATLEVTLIGPQLRIERRTTLAVAGAAFTLTLDGGAVEMNRPIDAGPGSVIRFGDRGRGARAYIAVAGGVDVRPVLGSRSTHVLTGMGGHEGRALRAGDLLTTYEGVGRGFSQILRKNPPDPFLGSESKLRVVVNDQRLAGQLAGRRYQLSPQSNRMGYQLLGPGLEPKAAGEMISRAVPTGSIQIPPTGQPILLMNDHATTGGYRLAGVVIAADLPVAGQLAPGDWVEFETCSVETADLERRRLEALLAAD